MTKKGGHLLGYTLFVILLTFGDTKVQTVKSRMKWTILSHLISMHSSLQNVSLKITKNHQNFYFDFRTRVFPFDIIGHIFGLKTIIVTF